MTKIEIFFNGKLYEGFSEEENIKKLEYNISTTVNKKGYYMLKSVDGLDVMFPRNALVNATVKLIGE